MTRLGPKHGLVLLLFSWAGMAAMLMGGMRWLGYVVQGLLVVVAGWSVWQVYLDYRGPWRTYSARCRAFSEWANRQRSNLKELD